MNCPRCKEEMKCPCKACRERWPGKPGTYWLDLAGGELEACGECGFTARIEWWDQRDWALMKGRPEPAWPQ